MTEVGLVIVAAGRGERLGFPEEKALVALLGSPILAWSLRVFEEFHQIVDRVVVVPPGREGVFRERVVDRLGSRHNIDIVAGGESRQDSVELGIQALSAEPHWVMVHDAARPLVTTKLVQSVLDTLDSGECVVPAMAPRDSLARRGYDQWIKSYENRDELLAVQTPQGFHRPVLEYAQKHAREHGHIATDEASLVLGVNHPVSWIEGEADNLKITFPGDLPLAEAVLRSRGYSGPRMEP